MHTPTKAQMQVVIDNLYKVLPRATQYNALDMVMAAVNEDHECGTTHCFGGWYAVAVLDNRIPMGYKDGINIINKHLGFYFTRTENFQMWAIDNPDIWGNSRGISMYSDRKAFFHQTKRPDGALNLKDIIDHLEEVRDRLPV